MNYESQEFMAEWQTQAIEALVKAGLIEMNGGYVGLSVHMESSEGRDKSPLLLLQHPEPRRRRSPRATDIELMHVDEAARRIWNRMMNSRKWYLPDLDWKDLVNATPLADIRTFFLRQRMMGCRDCEEDTLILTSDQLCDLLRNMNTSDFYGRFSIMNASIGVHDVRQSIDIINEMMRKEGLPQLAYQSN